MRTILFLLIIVRSADALGQPVIINSDSSRIVLPNNVTVNFAKTNSAKNTLFQFDDTGMRTLIAQLSFLHGTLTFERERSEILTKELETSDSVKRLLTKQLNVADERLKLYSSGYKELKSVSSAYDDLMKSSLADLESCRKANIRSKRKSFVRGVATGLAGGLVIGVCILLRDD